MLLIFAYSFIHSFLACLWMGQEHEGSVVAVKLTRNGLEAVSASMDETIRIWDLTTAMTRHVRENPKKRRNKNEEERRRKKEEREKKLTN